MFQKLETPVYHASEIAFVGRGSSNQAGVYLWQDGRLKVVADRSTFVPGTNERFRDFSRPTVDNRSVYFTALTGTETNFLYGLYQWREGNLSIVADRNTAVPDGSGKFVSFNAPFCRGGRLVFVGRGSENGDPNDLEMGLFIYEGGAIRKLVDGGDLVPGRNITFFDFNSQDAAFDFDGQRAVFLGSYGTVTLQDPTRPKIICSATVSGEVSAIADSPGYRFDLFSSRPRLDGDAVVFSAIENSFGEAALIVFKDSAPVMTQWWFVDVPGIGPLGLSGLLDVARHGRRMVFRGHAGTAYGLYWIDDDTGGAVIKGGLPFGGSNIVRNSSEELFDGRGFDGRNLAFKVSYTDLSEAIFLADLGVPPGEVTIDQGELSTSGFKLDLVHNSVTNCRIEFIDQISTNGSWQLLERITAPTRQFQVTDSSVPSVRSRFYRAVPE